MAQAPTDPDDRYFYPPDVATQDTLFRSVARAILPHTETHPGQQGIRAGAAAGARCLPDRPQARPVDGSALSPYVPALLDRIAELKPDRIILIKADAYDAAYPALAAADLSVSKVRIPFPLHGQLENFRVAFGRALAGE